MGAADALDDGFPASEMSSSSQGAMTEPILPIAEHSRGAIK